MGVSAYVRYFADECVESRLSTRRNQRLEPLTGRSCPERYETQD